MKKNIFCGLLIVSLLVLLINFSHSEYTDTGELLQNVNDCGNLNTINAVYNLTNNVNSTGTCFSIIANNITLNCNGYEINYSKNDLTGYGIYSKQYNLTTIKNCKIIEGAISTLRKYAIFLNNTYNITVDNNTIITGGGRSYGVYIFNSFNNIIKYNTINISGNIGIGIYTTNSSNNNEIYNNTILTKGPDSSFGILLEENSNYNIINNNSITTIGNSGTNHGIQIYKSDSNNITNNILNLSSSSSAINLESASINNRITENVVNTTVSPFYAVQMIGNGNNNTYIGNNVFRTIANVISISTIQNINTTIVNNTIYVSTNNQIGIMATINNIIANNTISTFSPGSSGIYFYNGGNNNILINNTILINDSNSYAIKLNDGNINFTIKDSILNSSLNPEVYINNLVTGGNWNFTNTKKYNGDNIVINWSAGANGTLNYGWWLDVYTNYTSGIDASNSNVSAWDVNNVLQFNELTNSTGSIERKTLLEYKQNNTSGVTTTYYSNYTFNVSLVSYKTQTQSWNMTTNRFLIFTMTDLIPPNLTIDHPNQTYIGITNIPLNYTVQDNWEISTCWYNVTIGASLDIANTIISNCLNTTFTVNFGNGNYIVHFCVNDTLNNQNCTDSSFTLEDYVAPAGPGGGGGGSTPPQTSTVCMKTDESSPKSEIERCILYARIRESCQEKINCILSENQKNDLLTNLKNQNLIISLEEIDIWLKNYNKNEIESIKILDSEISKYNLFTSIVQVIGLNFQVTPSRLDPFPFFIISEKPIFKTQIKSNRVLKSAEVIQGEFKVEIKNSTAIVILEFKDLGFSSKVFTGTISYISIDDETVFQTVNIRVINLRHAVTLFTIFGVGIIIILGIKFRRKIYQQGRKIFKKTL